MSRKLTDSNRHVSSHDISVRHTQKQHKCDIVSRSQAFSCEKYQVLK